MLRARLETHFGAVDILLRANRPNQVARVELSGTIPAKKLVENWLDTAFGARGHLIGDAASPVDLYVALMSVDGQMFFPEILTGHELLTAPGAADHDSDVVT